MENLYGLAFSSNANYSGRDQFGRIRTTQNGDGAFMTKECAEQLYQKFVKFKNDDGKQRYPFLRVVELLRGDRDAMAATSLAELGEVEGLDELSQVVRKLLTDGHSVTDIMAAVNLAVQG